MGKLQALWQDMVGLVWPARSLLTGAEMPHPGTIEPEAWARLDFLTPPWCHRCGLPFDTPQPDQSLCLACHASPPPYIAARAALAYGDKAAHLVLQLKRLGRRDGLPMFACWMANALAADPTPLPPPDLIVPVPLSAWKLWRRGFNQSGWMASALASTLKLPVAHRLLRRQIGRGTQAGLSARQRAAQLSGVFFVPKSCRARLAGRHVLLVDDVFTTGATVEAATRCLKRAGVRAVTVATLARVPLPRPVRPKRSAKTDMARDIETITTT